MSATRNLSKKDVKITTDHVLVVAVISDNKYIISGSKDKTISIWNLFEKTQETVLKDMLLVF